MTYVVSVFQTGQTVEWKTQNQHKFLGFMMGAAIEAGHNIDRAAQIAADALNTVMVYQTYEGTHFAAWQERYREVTNVD